MSTDSQSPSSILAHLRHELRTPINAIIGYSEMLLEEIEENGDAQHLEELEQIRECGVQLLNLIANLLNPSPLPNTLDELQAILTNPRLVGELKQPTQTAIECSQKLLKVVEADFVADVEKINKAANRLLAEIEDLVNLPQLRSTLSVRGAQSPDREVFNLSDKQSAATATASPQKNSNTIVVSEVTRFTSKPERDLILVVDDNETNRDLLSRQVKAQGYQAVTAANGQQAIEMIKTGQYDLILLDIMMPELDGYQVLKWKLNSPWRHIPTIMISALDEIDSVVKCIEMGAADYLTKPFNPVLLKARLSACLEQKRWRDQESLYLEQLAEANQKITRLNQLLQAENIRLSTELEVTQRLQSMILPKEIELNQVEGLEIAGFMQPADEVGGDYYDVLQHGDRTIIGIGDVTGHGLESGVLMLMVQTAVRTLMENQETDPKHFFEVLNRTIYKNAQRMNSDKNLTLCLVDYQQGKLSLSGQHEEVIIVRYGGVIERIDTIDLGFPIGLTETIEEFVFQTKIHLNSGDIAVLYTDGITEAENSLGVQYGIERLCEILQKNWQKSAKNIRQAVIENLQSYIGIQKIYDDVTLVILKQK